MAPEQESRDDRTDVSEKTQQAESREARAAHEPDRPPTEEEERLAEGGKVRPEVAEHYEEMAERGANQKGEGRI